MELWAYVLLGAGLVLILLEVFFPSFGVLGTLAAGALIAGGVCAWNAEPGVFTTYLMIAFVLGPVVTAFAVKMFPRSWFGRHYTLPGRRSRRKKRRPAAAERTSPTSPTGSARR